MVNDNWQTPKTLFSWIEEQMGVEFNLDPCTTNDNPLETLYYFTPKHNGLTQSWYMDEQTYAFMNPPYSRGEIDKWVKKARDEGKREDVMVAGLLPLRTSKWFMNHINKNGVLLPSLGNWLYLDSGQCGIYFLGSRVRFVNPVTGEQEKNSPFWDTFIAVWV